MISKGKPKAKKRRPTKTPEYKCANCGCVRYTPCTCKRSEKKLKEELKKETK